jgi:hypothetical protein
MDSVQHAWNIFINKSFRESSGRNSKSTGVEVKIICGYVKIIKKAPPVKEALFYGYFLINSG